MTHPLPGSERPSSSGGWRSVRTQLMLWNVLTLAGIILLLGLVTQRAVRTRLLASVDRELVARTQRIVAAPPPGARPGPPGPPPGSPSGPPQARPGAPGFTPRFPRQPLPPGPGPREILLPPDGVDPSRPGAFLPPEMLDPDRPGGHPPRVLDAAGRVLAPRDLADAGGVGPWDHHAFARAAAGEMVFSSVTVDGTPFRVISRPMPPRLPGARVVQAVYPLTDVRRAMAGLNRTLLLLVPVALFAAGLGGAVLTGRLLGPVGRLSRLAGRMGASDLSERLPVVGQDEFADLSRTVNGMLARLQAAFEEQGRLVERLRQTVERERRFTADASHELRTPLTVIKANTSLSLATDPSPDDVREAMAEIDRAADAASRLVEDLLLLARADAGQLIRERVPVDARAVVERAVAARAGRNGQREAEAAVHVVFAENDGSPPCVLGSADDLVRVVTNLLDNALRHTPPEGSVTVSAARTGELVRLAVADTGCGIAPEHLPHLGERFYRADASRSRRGGGSGLGLSLCREIVHAHGGAMDIRSAVGRGTTVTFTLPACDAEGAETARAACPPAFDPPEPTDSPSC